MWTGARGAVDLRAGTLVVRISRSRGEDNAPKTRNSDRTITLALDVVELLRAAQPLHVTRDVRLHHADGVPVPHRPLRRVALAPRAPRHRHTPAEVLRHTFVSVALSRGCKPKWVAKYCGTSLEMLDKHYGRWMDDDRGQLELLAPRGPNTGRRGPKPGPKPGPKRVAAASTRSGKRRGEIRTRPAGRKSEPCKCPRTFVPQAFDAVAGDRRRTPKRP